MTEGTTERTTERITGRSNERTNERSTKASPWPPPTRRAFVAMISAAAAALAAPRGARLLGDSLPDDDRPQPAAPRPTRWIGHC
jgi:hypothetical protein